MPFVPHKCHLNTFVKDRNSLGLLNPRVVVVVQLFLACAPCKCCRLIFFYCAVFCWLNWTANQSCFSPLCLFFHPATERGRCAECRPIKKKDMFAADYSPKMEQKNRQECEQQGIQTHSTLVSCPICATFFPTITPVTVCCSSSLSFSWTFDG